MMAFDDGGIGRSNEIPGLVDATKPNHYSWSFDGKKVKGYVAQSPALNSPVNSGSRSDPRAPISPKYARHE